MGPNSHLIFHAGSRRARRPASATRKRDCARRPRRRRALAVHAEGGVAPPEYDLRRALTERWAPTQANARNCTWAGHPDLPIRKALGRAEHGEALFASKYCLVVEGYAPWTPRLAEAVGAGCVCDSVAGVAAALRRPPCGGATSAVCRLRPADIREPAGSARKT